MIAAATGTCYGQAMTAGHIYTIAGNGTNGFSGDSGPATNAEISSVESVATNSTGHLYLADSSNDRIREITRS